MGVASLFGNLLGCEKDIFFKIDGGLVAQRPVLESCQGRAPVRPESVIAVGWG
jgi:hypothetical protein